MTVCIIEIWKHIMYMSFMAHLFKLVLFLFADQHGHCADVCKSVHFYDISAVLNSLTSCLFMASCLISVIINHLVCFLYTHCMLNDFVKNELLKKKSIMY